MDIDTLKYEFINVMKNKNDLVDYLDKLDNNNLNNTVSSLGLGPKWIKQTSDNMKRLRIYKAFYDKYNKTYSMLKPQKKWLNRKNLRLANKGVGFV